MNPNEFWAAASKTLVTVTLALIAILVLVPSAGAQFKTIYRFRGGTNGSGPSGLVFDAAGNLYGTTYGGGTYGYGTIFKLNKAGKKTVLYNFAGAPDGANPHPYANLIFDDKGNLYGTTYLGGVGNQVGGTVFELDAAGAETVLHRFCYGFPCTDGDGEFPTAGLLFDEAGNLYGTTAAGGYQYVGVVFKLTPNDGNWSETVLHSFEIADGDDVEGGLVWDSSRSTLYGTTLKNPPYGAGTVFKMDTTGALTVLHSFLNPIDGDTPYKPPLLDALDTLYGTDAFGGNRSCPGPFGDGCGTVWKLDTNGNLAVLHTFTGGKDGSSPLSGLVSDQAGNLYGMTSGGGIYGFGVVFEMGPTPSGGWTYRVIHAFRNRPGANPCSNLIIDAAGILYGSTQGDGITTFGSVFEIAP